MNEGKRYSIASVYYYLTPVFVLLGYFGGVNVRVAVLDSLPVYKYPYYGFCIVCGVIVYALPKAWPIVALFESMINVFMTAFGVFVPYLQNLQQVADINGDWKAAETINVQGLVNLALAGAIAVIAFKASLEQIAAASGFTKAGPDRPPAYGPERAEE
jgi:hypothetical protein